MAKRKRKSERSRDASAIIAIARKVWPHSILQALAKEYRNYPRHARNREEQDYWIKIAKSTANLGSGMEKWMEEMLDE